MLDRERVSVISEDLALRQDIRPLQIALLNLMPEKIKTETQLLRVLGATPLQIEMFVLGWKKLGFEQSLGTRLVTYADDLVILCRRGSAEKALHHLHEIMGKLKLTVNEEKTRICRVPDGEFDFLGYTFGRLYSPTTGKARLGYRPSKKSIKRMVERVHALTDRAGTWQETTGWWIN